jgi:cytochrome c oxidase subunit I
VTLIEEPAGAPRPAPAPAVTGRDIQAPTWRVDIPGATWADLRPAKWQLYLAIIGLGLGVAMGLLQALDRADVDLYDSVPIITDYYQGLTLHGVALALVFTFAFANGFMSLTTMKGFGRPLQSRALQEASLILAWVGTGMAAFAILAGKASVLFTFYAPLQATPAFYLGAALLVVSTWCVLGNQLLTLRAWRRAGNQTARIPLLAYISIVTTLMWFLASIGIAIEVLAFLLPWSLGLINEVDPQFTRILFWFSGHPIVYFWLLPVYVAWYTILVRQAGGRLYSDGLTRLAFLSFLVLLPVGVHHQFTDPGIPFSSKTIQWVLTFGIFTPSLLTAFSVIAGLEDGGRKRGGKGLFGWLWKLPWGDPVVSNQLLAGLAFFLGGMSGLINASYTMNLVVHNTSFIVGHFHLTVGTAVALSIMGLAYWMIPYLTGKQLAGRRWAVAQGWIWWIGVLIFSRGQMVGGIDGQPRRTHISRSVYLENNDWEVANLMTAFGGTMMFVGGAIFIGVVLATVFNSKLVPEPQHMPQVEVIHGSDQSWPILDKLWVWAAIAVVLSLVVYGEVLFHYLPINPVSRGFVLW